MKKTYVTPSAEKLVFDYSENVVASKGKKNNGDVGHGLGQGGGCDHKPGHGTPKTDHPNNEKCKKK